MSSEYSTSSESSTSFKVVVVGERAVGKTSLAIRYVKGVFSKVYAVTVGIEFYSKNIHREDETYSLNIWDTVSTILVRPVKKVSKPWSVPSTTRQAA